MRDIFGSCACGREGDCFALQSVLRRSDRLLASLVDSDHGAAGAALLERFRATRCLELPAEPGSNAIAHYVPFEGPRPPHWRNSIFYSMSAKASESRAPGRRSDEAIENSRHHEMLHACAWSAVPALHASPFNTRMGLIVSPWDWVAINELTERDVYAKQGWLSYLSMRRAPRFAEATLGDPICAFTFEKIYRDCGSLSAALVRSASLSLAKPWGRHPATGVSVDFLGRYQYHALCSYENIIDIILKQGMQPVVVRLEPFHLAALGRSFGPNIFMLDSASFAVRPSLDGFEQATVERICGKLGIAGEERLPWFEDALRAKGMTAARFMDVSKGTHRADCQGASPALPQEGRRAQVTRLGLSSANEPVFTPPALPLGMQVVPI